MSGEQPESSSADRSSTDTSQRASSNPTLLKSPKAGLAVLLSAGFLSLLAAYTFPQQTRLLIRVALVAVFSGTFLLGWHTRRLVHNRLYVALGSGALAAAVIELVAVVELLQRYPALISWHDLTSGLLLASAFCSCPLALRDVEGRSSVRWPLTFAGAAVLLCTAVVLLQPAPVTAYLLPAVALATALYLSAVLLLALCMKGGSRQVALRLNWSLAALVVASLLELVSANPASSGCATVAVFARLCGGVLLYLAVVEGTLRSPVRALARDLDESHDELSLELVRRLGAEKSQAILLSEVMLLYHLSRALHQTLNLDALAHLILSTATGADTGRFTRAALFTVNRRAGTLQGMLGVSRELSALVLPCGHDASVWERLHLDEAIFEAQRDSTFNRQVLGVRFDLADASNPLVKAVSSGSPVTAAQPGKAERGEQLLSQALELESFACAPLTGRDEVLGVLLVDSPEVDGIGPGRCRFLEVFAALAGSALDNASMVKRLELAHANLREVQDELIHGEKMASLGEMAAQVAHELRNPLVTVGGFARRLAKQELVDPRANEYAGIIAREVERLEQMLGNILDFSKKQLVCLEPCRIDELLRETVELEEEPCRQQGVDVELKLTPLPEIMGDCRQLRQVFLNLVINARQAMGEGGRLLVAAEAATLRGEPVVTVSVEDTGGGISPQVMRNIFNPFFSTHSEGTGLGLPVSHRIVTHHHGTIEVINVAGGARFVVTLPVSQRTISGIDSAGEERVD
jgi:signal transduction histidine kinase